MRPLDFCGIATRPTVEFLPIHKSNVGANRANLSAYMQFSGVVATHDFIETSSRPAGGAGSELSEAELANVAGGSIPAEMVQKVQQFDDRMKNLNINPTTLL